MFRTIVQELPAGSARERTPLQPARPARLQPPERHAGPARRDLPDKPARPGRQHLPERCDVAVLGGGMAGMATAMRLQASHMSTVVLEAHGHIGGCAGYFRRQGFSFDVGATTLGDFEPGGVGAELL